MSIPSPTVLLGLVLLAAAPATAQSPLTPCASGPRRVDLTAEPSDKVPTVCVSPGLSTLIEFDPDSVMARVELEGREHFNLVDQGKTTLRLVPSEQVAPGMHLRLTVRFEDGAAPVSTTFWLVGHPGKAGRLEVFRHRRTAESLQLELSQKDADLQRSREEAARLRVRLGGRDGLMGLVSARHLGEEGILSQIVGKGHTVSPKNKFTLGMARSFRTSSGPERGDEQRARVAVELWLTPPKSRVPWVAKDAILRSTSGHTLEVSVWQESINPDQLLVVAETESTMAETRGTFSLELWDETGTRTYTLDGVTFP